MATVPVYASHGQVLWCNALIDDEFLPFVKEFDWSRWQDDTPPRTNIYIQSKRGREQPSPVFLHRLVFLLSITPEEDRMDLVSSDYTNLLLKLREIPRLKLVNPENPHDCRLSNIDGRLKKKSAASFVERRNKLVEERRGLVQAGLVKPLTSEKELESLASIDKIEADYQRQVRIRESILAELGGEESNDLAADFRQSSGIASKELVAQWDARRLAKGWPLNPKHNELRPEHMRVPPDAEHKWVHEGSDKLNVQWSDEQSPQAAPIDTPQSGVSPLPVSSPQPSTPAISTKGMVEGQVRVDPSVVKQCEDEIPPPPSVLD